MMSKHLAVNTFFTNSILLVLLVSKLVISSNGTPVSYSPHLQDLFRGPEVFLTISSIAGYKEVVGINGSSVRTITDRKLVLNWHGLSTPESGSFVGLYEQDPTTLLPQNLRSSAVYMIPLRSDLSSGNSGRVVTSARYPRSNWTSTSPRCTGFWAVHGSNNGSVIQSNCFKIYPTWLNDIKDIIRNVPLHSLMMAGTHNSGAFNILDGTADNVLTNYVVCQEDSIYQQLIHGIRYLDIRIAYYPETKEKFWINHDVFRVRPFTGVLLDVEKFVQETNEIIFLDFHRFPVGFNDTVHAILIQLLEKELGTYLAPKSLTSNATPGDFWKLNKTIVVGYPSTPKNSKHEFLWPNVNQAWGNTNKLMELEKFLSRSHHENGCRRKFWASMAHLTFNFQDIFTRPDFGIRGFANISNPEITEWYRSRKWHGNSNIVATDYYLSTNLIEMSFRVNENKASLCVM